MTERTPGPWSYFHDTCAKCEREGRAEYDLPEVPAGHHGRFSNEADARLIAAAPELLDALKNIAAWLGSVHEVTDAAAEADRMADLEIAAAKAIAKAEGRSLVPV